MKRLKLSESEIRPDNEEQNEKIGFDYHTMDERPYWKEDSYYQFTSNQVSVIEKATEDLHQKCFQAIQYIIDKNLFSKMGIDEKIASLIKKSWEKEEWSMFGRFDFYFDDKSKLKMFEYNADTPTSLLEASLAQWEWKNGISSVSQYDQFNSIHEKLIDWWRSFKDKKNPGVVYFGTIKNNLEDYRNVEYVMDCAHQAGIEIKFIFLEDLGTNGKEFYDLDDNKVDILFKLYPWEWLFREEISKDLINILENDSCQIIEPVWKMLLSNKAILAILWELFPRCPYLIPTHFDDHGMLEYVKKPFLSREGQNIEIHTGGSNDIINNGHYASENNVYQALYKLPCFDGFYPVVGSWVVGELSAGMGIREDESIITANMSYFVSHIVKN
jgi:glutathionylspermidine synthase